MSRYYRQPEKNAARERVLNAAISALTENRKKSAIVVPDELSDTIEFAMQDLVGEIDRNILAEEFGEWQNGYRACIGHKKPSELRVLYLCGPEPLNDLTILIENGVSAQNVWAVERNSQDLSRAVRELARTYPTVRLHHGDLEGLFQVYPGRFDIVYFDACGTFFSRGVPNVLLALAAHAKLEPMAALITNFANFDGNDANAVASRQDRAAALDAMCQFFRYRYNDLPRAAHDCANIDPGEFPLDDTGLRWCLQQNAEPFYSDFYH